MPDRSDDAPPSSPIGRLQDTVRLSADGLAKVLGDLEARVLQTAWRVGEPATSRTMHEIVVRDHPVALHTVITVLNKLVAKQLLRREKRGEILHYEARLSEDEFYAQASRRVVEGVLSLNLQAMTASFVDVLAERDPDSLAELLELVRRRTDEQAR
jgi:BlaI family transcriptional regulator, penicillinase repressor